MAEDIQFEIGFYESVLKRLPKDPQVTEILGCLYTQVGRIDEGLAMDQRAIKLSPKSAIAHYNLACSLCLKNIIDKSLETLEKAIKLGYDDAEWMRQDPDFKQLRDHPHFIRLLKSISK